MPAVGDVEVYLPPTVEVVVESTTSVTVSVEADPVSVAPIPKDAVEVSIVNDLKYPNSGFFVGPASPTLGGHRLITVDASGAPKYASCTDTGSVGSPIGVSSGSISTEAKNFLITNGYLKDPSFTFSPGETLYLGENGVISSYDDLPSVREFTLPIGAAISATEMQVCIPMTPILTP